MSKYIHLRRNGVSLLIDAGSTAGALPRIVHYGADLGETPTLENVRPHNENAKWGARLDEPVEPCILPGIEAGYFGVPALEPAHAGHWSLDGVSETSRSVTFRLKAILPRGDVLGLEVEYRLASQGVLASQVRVVSGDADVSNRLRRVASLCLPLSSETIDLVTLGGDWAREFSIARQTLPSGCFTLESRRGRPGHDRYPAVFLGARHFDEMHGEVYAVTLGWSGSHRITVERLREGRVVVQASELLSDDETLGAQYQAPWCYAAFSAQGLNGVLQKLHAFAREELIPPAVAAKPRPVHYNTWEAVYFKHDLETLKGLADRAAGVGAERFVLDDGWFKGRNNDRSSLGDWVVDSTKYPHGLTPLIEHVCKRGLEFGLWVEPEMINPDSDLARAHPDWIRRDGAGLVLQRHQAVLDMGNAEVRAFLLKALDTLLARNDIRYLKWDMNRDVTGGGHHAYVAGVYALIDDLRARHPSVEIETCASGGGRCDYGMLTRSERVWVSDSNDALDRFDIQRNANLLLPPEISGVHVGPQRCHITGRTLGLDLRAHVAMFGHMGLELDLRELGAKESERLGAHIANYKRFRSLIHAGRYWRIEPPDPDHKAVGVSNEAGTEALVLLVRVGSHALGQGSILRIPGLDERAAFSVGAVLPVSRGVEHSLALSLRSGNYLQTGRVLSAVGLELFLPRPETSLLLHIKLQ